MSDPTKRPLFADVRRECGALGVELREMLSARWELARLELAADLRSAQQLLVAWLAAIVLAIAALPVLVVCLAGVLDGRAGIPRTGWLLIFGGGLLLLAVAGGYLAWRRFRRRFIGLRETLEELREDVLWLQEKGRKNDE
jgi:uncharacterized membrane protein YqjE